MSSDVLVNNRDSDVAVNTTNTTIVGVEVTADIAITGTTGKGYLILAGDDGIPIATDLKQFIQFDNWPTSDNDITIIQNKPDYNISYSQPLELSGISTDTDTTITPTNEVNIDVAKYDNQLNIVQSPSNTLNVTSISNDLSSKPEVVNLIVITQTIDIKIYGVEYNT